MKRIALLFFMAVSMAVVAAPGVRAGETFRDGLRAYNTHNFKAAYAIWLRLAEHNDAKAQASLGYMYYSGQGVPQSSRSAADWFYRAANQGEPTAQLFLSVMHFNADGVPRNLELSLMWCELAMAEGNVDAYSWRTLIMDDTTAAQRNKAYMMAAEWHRIHDANIPP